MCGEKLYEQAIDFSINLSEKENKKILKYEKNGKEAFILASIYTKYTLKCAFPCEDLCDKCMMEAIKNGVRTTREDFI